MAKWFGLDFGTKRIGVSAGNDTDGIASPLTVIEENAPDRIIARITELIHEYDVQGIVVGWPLNMDDTEGPQGKLTRQFAQQLAEETHLDVRLWDERLTSYAADQVLAGQFTRKKKKQRQDAVAAAVILQDFLSAGGPSGAPRPDEIED